MAAATLDPAVLEKEFRGLGKVKLGPDCDVSSRVGG